MKLPLRARLSWLHQRAILTVRWFFRLPIDEVRETERQSIDQQISETLQTLGGLIAQLESRLHWYETRVPELRRQHRAWVTRQKKLQAEHKAKQAEFRQLVEDGMSEHEARERVWPPMKENAK